MRKIILTILTFCFTQHLYSQGFINSNKLEAKKYLIQYIDKEKTKTSTTESDTSIEFLVRDTSVQNLDLILQFDASGKCYKELRTLSCDSCYEKILNNTLNEIYWGWIKIDSKTYLSKFRKHLILNLQVDNSRSFEIRRIDINRNEYKEKLEKKIS